MESEIYVLKTTANREDQVLDFLAANVTKKGLAVYSAFRPHGTRGYVFVEAKSRKDAEEAYFGVPYARGLLSRPVEFSEIENLIGHAKVDVNIKVNDIVEIISGPFKRDRAKVVRIDKIKDEVVIELLEAAIPIPMTVSTDSVRVIRREGDEEENE
jgi:transcriptional antiterminator NusG